MSAIAQTWTIEKNKNPKFDGIVDAHIDKFLPDQLISLSEYYKSEKKLEKAYKCISKLWAFSPCIKIDKEFEKIVSIIKEINDPEQTAHLVYLAIDIGDQTIAKEAYQIFYRQYFDKFDLEDEKIYLWENLWKKINNNPGVS